MATPRREEKCSVSWATAQVLVPRKEIDAHEPIGMSNRKFLPQFVPDRIG
jgi:hypothetical protein